MEMIGIARIGRVRFALVASALAVSLATLAPTAGASGASRANAAHRHATAHRGHGRDHDAHQGHHALVTRALGLSSLSNAQRAQVEALAQEEKTMHMSVHAARGKVMTTLAGQVERGAIDRNALAPALKEETDAIVAARLRERSIAERLHTVLTAKQCEEVGGGKDFLPSGKPQEPEATIRAKAEAHAGHIVDRIEKKLAGPSPLSPEERARIAAHLRARSAGAGKQH